MSAGNVAQVLETLDKLVPLTKTAREAREAPAATADTAAAKSTRGSAATRRSHLVRPAPAPLVVGRVAVGAATARPTRPRPTA